MESEKVVIVPAARLGAEAMATLFNACYSDYHVPVSLTADVFRAMAATQDVDLESSPVVLHAGEPRAFALLGVRPPAGWIGGMGVVPDARRHGLGRMVMERAIAAAHGLGLERVDLEVIEENERAHALYVSLGFRERRWLDVLERPPGPAVPPAPAAPVDAIEPADFLRAYRELHPAPAPWQRAPVVLERSAAALTIHGVREGGTLVACAAAKADEARVQIMDVGLRPGAPAAALAAAVASLLALHPRAGSGLVNLPAADPAGDILRGLGYSLRLRQREMWLPTATSTGPEAP